MKNKKTIRQKPKATKYAIVCATTIAVILLFIALTIYLIWLIPNEFASLQTIITTIVAAIYGGLLTLVGVAWTIKKGEKDRKEDLERRDREKAEEERKKFKPIAVYYKGASSESHQTIECDLFDVNKHIGSKASSDKEYKYIINSFMLQNMDFSTFFVEGLIFNHKIIFYRSANLYVAKNRILHFTFNKKQIQLNEEITSFGLLIKDLLDNEYVIDFGFEKLNKQGANNIEINITGSKAITLYKE